MFLWSLDYSRCSLTVNGAQSSVLIKKKTESLLSQTQRYMNLGFIETLTTTLEFRGFFYTKTKVRWNSLHFIYSCYQPYII